jgi:hypothetical protein
MRPSCLNCARKHLAKAEITLHESKQGYPSHFWLCMGNMSEAEDELLRDYPELSNAIRNERKLLEDNPSYEVPLMELIDRVTYAADEEELPNVDRKRTKTSRSRIHKARSR